MGGFASLFQSRKVLLAILGVVQTLVLHYLDIPMEVWTSINGLLLVLIGSIAWEDAAEKRSMGPETAFPVEGQESEK